MIADERGSLGGLEGLSFGILLFAFGTLMVVNAWAVIDGKTTANTAAREAIRHYVEAPDANTAVSNANAAAQAVAGERRRASTSLNFRQAPGFAFRRCDEITASVSIMVPRISLPLIGGTGGHFAVTSTHSEVIDPYRSGLPSTSRCS